MTPGQAKTLARGIMQMDWSTAGGTVGAKAFADAFSALCQVADGPSLFTPAAKPELFRSVAPMVMLTSEEARGVLEHMQFWRDGETLLSAKLHGQAQGYCLALRVLAADADAEFKRGLRLVKVQE